MTGPVPVPPQAMQAAAQAEREWKRRAGMPDTETGYDTGRIRAMVEAAAPHLAAAEREACAQLAESVSASYLGSERRYDFADLLRERGEGGGT